MRIENFSQLLGLVAWASIITLSWLIILRAVPTDPISFVFLAFFLTVAFFAYAIDLKNSKRKAP